MSHRVFHLGVIQVFLCAFLLAPFTFAVDRLEQSALQQQQAQRSLLLSIARAGENIVAVGEQGTIISSQDQGKSWTQAPVPVSTLLTRVAFADADSGWVVGHDGVVLQTLDGGKSWIKQLDGNQINQLIITALKQQKQQLQQRIANLKRSTQPDADIDALGEQIENLEYSIEDAQALAEEGATIPLLDLAVLNAQEVFVVGAYGLALKTRDGGKSWQYFGHQIPNLDKLHINRILRATDGAFYMAGEQGLLLSSKDHGTSWNLINSPYSGSWYNLLAMDDHLYVMGLRGHLYRLYVKGLRGHLHRHNQSAWERIRTGKTATINEALWHQGQLFVLGNAGLLIKFKDDQANSIPTKNLSFSQGLIVNDKILLVGENGVHSVALEAGEKSE